MGSFPFEPLHGGGEHDVKDDCSPVMYIAKVVPSL
jgi:hypothetical protein